MSALVAPANELAIWHDVECGAYDADLAAWDELAAAHPGPVLELGAGTGRVTLRLAQAGHDAVAVDRVPALLAELEARAAVQRLAVETVEADVCSLGLGREFGVVLAPMQLFQVLGGPDERRAALRAVAAHLAPGGLGAAAIVEAGAEAVPFEGAGEALPDVREVDGWVYSSLPVGVRSEAGAIEARRLRQRVSPAGDLEEWTHVDRLAVVEAGSLDAEAAEAGLRRAGRLLIPSTDLFVGSTVCLWEAAS